MILSAGSFGCNMRCPFCQNSDISMAGEDTDTRTVSPEALVRQAVALAAHGNIGIAYTYNEPFVGYEYVADTARLAREAGLVNVLVTNGMVCGAPLKALLPYIDAMNIDLKCFSDEGYRRLGGDLDTVLATIRASAAACHVEVTTLVVPGLSDNPADMEAEAAWLASLDPDLPLHLSRFFPRYHMADAQPTPLASLQTLRDIAAKAGSGMSIWATAERASRLSPIIGSRHVFHSRHHRRRSYHTGARRILCGGLLRPFALDLSALSIAG